MNKALLGLVSIAEKGKLSSRHRNMERITAFVEGQPTYTRRLACNICGTFERYTSSNCCVACHRRRSKASYHRNKNKEHDDES